MSGSAHRYKVHTDSVASSHSPSLQDHVHLPGHLEEDEGQSLMTSVHKHHYQGNRNRFPAPQHHTKRNAGRNSTSADDGNQKPSKINGGNAHDDGDDYDHGSDDGDGTISKSETSSMRSRAQKGTENPYRFSMAQYDPQHYKPTYNNESLTVQRVRDMVEHIENMQAKRQKCVMHPMSPYTAKWDIFVLLLLMFTAIVTPYEIAFFDVELNGLFIVNRIVDLGFLLDMIFRFYRGYVDFNGAYVFDRNLIRRRYTERWFWLDLVSLVPYDLVGYSLESSNVTHLKTLRLLRLIRLSKLMNFVRGFSVIKRWQSEFGIRHAAVSLVQFGIALMLVSHWGACIWAMVPVIEEADEDSESWMSAYNVHEASAGEQYMAALYWSSMTVTTIGYGDVSPKTTGERIVAVICMFVGGAIYAYIIGKCHHIPCICANFHSCAVKLVLLSVVYFFLIFVPRLL